MHIQAYIPVTVEYVKDSGEYSVRKIIPTMSIVQNIRAIDLTQEDETKQNRLTELMKDYEAYVQQHMANLFNFQDWVEHSTSRHEHVSWRTFKTSNLKIIEG